MYYNVLIKWIMLSDSCAWSTALEENIQHVSKLQKWAARVILDALVGERSEGLFRRLDWLLVKDKVNIQKCSLIFRLIANENNCPIYIMQLLPMNSDLPCGAILYGKYDLVCPRHNRETEGGHTF